MFRSYVSGVMQKLEHCFDECRRGSWRGPRFFVGGGDPAGTLARDTVTDHLLCFWPNPTTSPQTLYQLAILGEKEADPMLGKPRLAQKLLNFFDDWLCHDGQITRFSVQVNTRYYVQARHVGAC